MGKAIEAEMKTLELDCAYIPALDLLAHAYGGLGNWERTGFYGHQALVLKDKAIPDLQHEIIPERRQKMENGLSRSYLVIVPNILSLPS